MANRVVTIGLAISAAGVWVLTLQPRLLLRYFDSDVFLSCAITLSVAACLGWVLLWLSESRGDDETRCRKCRHILRGISEPRCPECGERISFIVCGSAH